MTISAYLYVGAESILEWAVTTLNHLEMMSLAKNAVPNRTTLAAFFLAGAR